MCRKVKMFPIRFAHRAKTRANSVFPFCFEQLIAGWLPTRLIRHRVGIHPILMLFVLAFGAYGATPTEVILRATGMTQSTRDALRAQLDQVRASHPELPASTWAKVKAEIESPSMEQEMGRIWGQMYTPAELKEISAFLSTPTGKKFFKTNPSLMPRLASVAALSGMKAFQVLQTLHPALFPKDPKQEADAKRLFETMKNGPQGTTR